MDNNSNRKIINPAGISILLAGILWGSMGLFVRGLNAGGFDSMEIVEIRVFFSSIIMGLFIFFYDKSLFKIRLKDIWCFIGTGVVSLTFFNLCYFRTILMTSLSVAAILLYTAPIFVVLLSALLFKEKITRNKVWAMILAFVGCFFVTGIVAPLFTNGLSSMSISVKGILIGLGSGLGYALYSIFGRYALEREYSSMTISFYTFMFSLIATLIIKPPISVVNKLVGGDVLKNLLLSVGICLFATIFPYLLYTFGLKGVENGKASIMASIEPVVATLIGIIVFRESLSFSGIIGVVMVLAAIVLLNRKGMKR